LLRKRRVVGFDLLTDDPMRFAQFGVIVMRIRPGLVPGFVLLRRFAWLLLRKLFLLAQPFLKFISFPERLCGQPIDFLLVEQAASGHVFGQITDRNGLDLRVPFTLQLDKVVEPVAVFVADSLFLPMSFLSLNPLLDFPLALSFPEPLILLCSRRNSRSHRIMEPIVFSHDDFPCLVDLESPWIGGHMDEKELRTKLAAIDRVQGRSIISLANVIDRLDAITQRQKKTEKDVCARLLALEFNQDRLIERLEEIALRLQKLDLAYYEAFPDRADADLRFQNQLDALVFPPKQDAAKKG
jgi:hypothetical protein